MTEQPQTPLQPEIVLNEKNAHVAYSNFARVTATPEEVVYVSRGSRET
jgi:hypothetical protein